MNNPSEEKRVPGGQGTPSGTFGDGGTPFPQPGTGEPPAAAAGETAASGAEAGDGLVVEEASTRIQELQQALAQAEAKAEENWDRSVRLQADMDNQRRRLEKQIEDAHKYSVHKFVESLLPVMDSLEMGLQAEGSIEKIREGMELTLKQFAAVMEKFNIEAIDPLGQPFDPEKHQAVSMQASPDHDNNTVMLVMQKGYTLSGRTVRPAMVMVCKK